MSRPSIKSINGSSQQPRNVDSNQHPADTCLTSAVRSAALLRNHPSYPQNTPRNTPISDDAHDEDFKSRPLSLSDLPDALRPKAAADERYHSAIYTKLGVKADVKNKSQHYKALQDKRFDTEEETFKYDMENHYLCAVCTRIPDQKANYSTIFFKESTELTEHLKVHFPPIVCGGSCGKKYTKHAKYVVDHRGHNKNCSYKIDGSDAVENMLKKSKATNKPDAQQLFELQQAHFLQRSSSGHWEQKPNGSGTSAATSVSTESSQSISTLSVADLVKVLYDRFESLGAVKYSLEFQSAFKDLDVNFLKDMRDDAENCLRKHGRVEKRTYPSPASLDERGVPAKRPRRGAAQSIPFEEPREGRIMPTHHVGQMNSSDSIDNSAFQADLHPRAEFPINAESPANPNIDLLLFTHFDGSSSSSPAHLNSTYPTCNPEALSELTTASSILGSAHSLSPRRHPGAHHNADHDSGVGTQESISGDQEQYNDAFPDYDDYAQSAALFNNRCTRINDAHNVRGIDLFERELYVDAGSRG